MALFSIYFPVQVKTHLSNWNDHNFHIQNKKTKLPKSDKDEKPVNLGVDLRLPKNPNTPKVPSVRPATNLGRKSKDF
jgi:hypothetical protein